MIEKPAGGGNVKVLTDATYQPFGPVASWVVGNGSTYIRGFDEDGRITALSLPAGDKLTLTYDAASRIKGVTETGLSAKTFTYDPTGRLLHYASGANTQTYAYDLAGNRRSFVSTGSTALNLTYSYPQTSNRLAGITGTGSGSFTYDAAGDTVMTGGGTYEFTYDGRGRMSSSALGAFITSYVVNGIGQRTAKINETTGAATYFTYDEAGHLIGEYNHSGVAIEETIWLGDLPVATIQRGGLYFIAPDHLGAPHEITDAAAQIVWSWDHDPFGNGAPKTVAGFTYNLQFPGQIFDQETELNYNYYRDYDPVTAQFVESDPIGLAAGINTYAYGLSNPIEWIDPTGWDATVAANAMPANVVPNATVPGPDGPVPIVVPTPNVGNVMDNTFEPMVQYARRIAVDVICSPLGPTKGSAASEEINDAITALKAALGMNGPLPELDYPTAPNTPATNASANNVPDPNSTLPYMGNNDAPLVTLPSGH